MATEGEKELGAKTNGQSKDEKPSEFICKYDGDIKRSKRKRPKIRCKPNRSLEQYIVDRVQYKINLYFKKGNRNRAYHYLLAVLIGLSAAIVPILINLKDETGTFQILATILSLLVTICVALQEIFRFREHWRNYNLIDSNLRKEEMLFSMSAAPYEEDKKDPSKRERLFVQIIERLIEEERKETIYMRTNDNAKSDNGNKPK